MYRETMRGSSCVGVGEGVRVGVGEDDGDDGVCAGAEVAIEDADGLRTGVSEEQAASATIAESAESAESLTSAVPTRPTIAVRS
jgi:hypothetical protein